MKLLTNSNGNIQPLAIMLLVSVVVALYIRANRENFYVTGAATFAAVKLGKRGVDHTRNIPLAGKGQKAYGTKCRKHKRYANLKPGEQGPCRIGYYFQEKKKLGCFGKSARAVCSRINVPKLGDFSKKVKKKRVRAFKPPDDEAGDAYCNAKAGVESGYKMTRIKGAGRGKRRYYCVGTEPENPDADFRAAYQTKCMKRKRFKGTVGKQGKCKDGYTTKQVAKTNCFFRSKRAKCIPTDYDMSVYPINVGGGAAGEVADSDEADSEEADSDEADSEEADSEEVYQNRLDADDVADLKEDW